MVTIPFRLWRDIMRLGRHFGNSPRKELPTDFRFRHQPLEDDFDSYLDVFESLRIKTFVFLVHSRIQLPHITPFSASFFDAKWVHSNAITIYSVNRLSRPCTHISTIYMFNTATITLFDIINKYRLVIEVAKIDKVFQSRNCNNPKFLKLPPVKI